MKVAIIGSGISGLSCAWLLNQKYDITLFEENNYLGGHSNTASITYNDKEIDVDTGFIVFNFRTYPNLKALFELLNVKIQKSNMSFGIKNLDNNLEYSGSNLTSLFAQKKNLCNIKFWMMLKDILKFNRNAIKTIKANNIADNKTLNEFINELKLGKYFKDYYLLPMASAIWSCPLELITNYPVKTFLQFFYNHGLLNVKQDLQWYTIEGGSKEYVNKISENFQHKIKLNTKIIKTSQSKEKIILTDQQNNNYKYDHVIFATHTDQTYQIISDKTSMEEKILSKINYNKNIAVLHKDINQMPRNKKTWASWVCLSKQKTKEVSLSYWMNNLQNIDDSYPLFVTLNPINKINKNDIFGEYQYAHPIF